MKNYIVKKNYLTNFWKDWNRFPEVSELTTLLALVTVVVVWQCCQHLFSTCVQTSFILCFLARISQASSWFSLCSCFLAIPYSQWVSSTLHINCYYCLYKCREAVINMSYYCRCSGVLKMYLRELPEPLMTFELYDEWMRLVDMYVTLKSLS